MYRRMIYLLIGVLISTLSTSPVKGQEPAAVDTDQEFIQFLEDALENGMVNEETTGNFYRRTWAYWFKNKEDYNQNPEKYNQAISLYHRNQEKYKRNREIKIDRFEKAIENFRRFDLRNTLPENPVLFIGSSSIVFWETAKSFPDLPVINRGFGGASLPEIMHYYDDIVKQHNPSVVVIYCDIDVESGKSPEVAANAFQELVNRIRADFPETQILILSMKPTLIDDFLGKEVGGNKLLTNEKLMAYCEGDENLHYVDITSPMLNAEGKVRADIFIPDGMHLNATGYTVWDPIIRTKIESLTGKR